jgi:hypothetical protein
VCALKVPLERIRVLSIGTTSEPYFLKESRRKAGKVKWAQHAAPLFLQAQVQATLGRCDFLLKDRFMRFDEIVGPGRFSLDSANDVLALRALGEQAARVAERGISASFLSDEAARFEPHHRPS